MIQSQNDALTDLLGEHGVHRLGDQKVNFYLIEQAGGLILVDAGLPTHFAQLSDAVTAIGRSMHDITDVLITHAHPDHVGIAARVQRETGARIWVHSADAPIVSDPKSMSKHWKAERSLVPYILRRPAMLSVPIHLGRNGAFKPAAVANVNTFADGEVLPVPGAPTAIQVPGHTTGSTAFAFPGMIFTGDALVTRDDIIGRSGPRIVARAFTQNGAQALASIGKLVSTDAALVLPGHGDPYTGGIAKAVREATAAGIS
jgi:glyoxylase-like metal-dependent hydrolase (beta-lactamase superfamily II)